MGTVLQIFIIHTKFRANSLSRNFLKSTEFKDGYFLNHYVEMYTILKVYFLYILLNSQF